MAGTRGPKPWPQRQARTIFLRVPADDFAAVRLGSKTEFRIHGGHTSALWSVEPPTVVVGYRLSRSGDDHQSCLLVLEKVWTEPLAAISEESLQREGFETMAHFRRYWMSRTKRRFRPLDKVRVCRIRPFQQLDREEMALRLLQALYGDHLDA